jgi:hypothetical protein
VQAIDQDLRPLLGVQFGRVESEQHDMVGRKRHAGGAQRLERVDAPAEEVGHSHGVENPARIRGGGAEVGVPVEAKRSTIPPPVS